MEAPFAPAFVILSTSPSERPANNVVVFVVCLETSRAVTCLVPEKFIKKC